MRNSIFYLALTGLVCTQSVLAAEQRTNMTPTATHSVNQQALDTYSLNSDNIQQQKNREQAQRWGLTETEWQRYLEIKNYERSYWSPNLDPLTTLGVEAKTDAERRRYAELLAKKEYERVEKELAFQRAYDQAFQRLYPNQLPFEVEPHVSQATGRIYYFTRLDDCEKCETDIHRILTYANNKTPIDIYVVGSSGNDEAIRKWATKHHIDPAKVKSRQITLNHDSGYWLRNGNGKMPVAFQVQGDGQWQSIIY
ncbi:TIGR03759 family integrating conjugative element protein [Caviibacterium pharyngocola]|uniref:TIGR03759 family integrating conjugative element protein n=1 Tax=Caviibacterium pharyngocola TaxID=28159 RepID=A0A2M8RV54_9PAST|nr:TIGR03759 family integrating conjugative element protein [Caviibacterium pharyngocola]PJG82770.1 TIGR03759 family integrating conjugative element protein [Caviibacterium pharyngocola]